jgi:hypothetical protein
VASKNTNASDLRFAAFKRTSSYQFAGGRFVLPKFDFVCSNSNFSFAQSSPCNLDLPSDSRLPNKK